MHDRRWTLVVWVVTLVLLIPRAHADLKEVKLRGVLRVLAVFPEGPDEFFARTTEAPGFDHELLEGFAHLQRVRLEVIPIARWDALIPALKNDKGDMIAGRFTVTEGRQKVVNFTTETFPSRCV